MGFAVAALIALAIRDRPEPFPTMTAEPVGANAAAPTPSVSPVPAATLLESVATARQTPPAVPKPKPSPRATLGEEIAALDAVRSEISAGNASGALKALDTYETGGARRLGAEATLLRVEALRLAGRSSDADALARRFIESNPGNPLVDRARALVSIPTDAGGSP